MNFAVDFFHDTTIDFFPKWNRSSVVQKKFKHLQLLDGKQLEKMITFEEDESTSRGPKSVDIPPIFKMVVNDQVGDFIGKFLEQFYKVYDSDNREQLAMAYHEDALMSMQANFPKFAMDDKTKEYITDSRNLQIDFVRENSSKRDRLLHQKRLQIIGFLDKLPKTQHDLTSFTLDVPFATDRLVTFTVTGAFREREAKLPQPIRHFSRMFTVIPQGEGLCIVNDSYFVTNASREQTERSNGLFQMSQETGMNLQWSKICLEGQGWNLEQAKSAFITAKQEGKIPPEAFT